MSRHPHLGCAMLVSMRGRDRRSRARRWQTTASRAQEQVLPNQLVVMIILCAVAITGLCFLYVWQGVRIAELTAQAEELRVQLDSVQEVNRILTMRIEQAFSMERVAEIARDRLGMRPPTDIRYVQLPASSAD